MEVTITTRKLHRRYEAANGPEAVQSFFDDITSGKVALSELGFIGTWTVGKEDYPFRIGPALFKCGLLTQERLNASFAHAGVELGPEEVAAIVKADAWMVRADSEEVDTIQ